MSQPTSRPPRTPRRRIVTFPRLVAATLGLLALGGLVAAIVPATRWAHGTGFALTRHHAELYPLVAGHVQRVLVRSGDTVEAGQPLVQLHDDLQRAALEAADPSNNTALLRIELDQRTVRSPLAGVVHLHRFDPGEYVQPDQALGQVFDPADWIVRVQLGERTLPHVHLDQQAFVYLAAHHRPGGRPMPARVARIDPVVTPRATGDGVYSVELSLEPPDGLLLEPGMTAWARIDTGQTTWLRRILGF